MPLFGRKKSPSEARSDGEDLLQQAGDRAAYFVDKLQNLSPDQWLRILERGGKQMMTRGPVVQEAATALRTLGEETGMMEVARVATSRVDISPLLPPYPRPGQREQMQDVLSLGVAAVLLRDLLPGKHFETLYFAYEDAIPLSSFPLGSQSGQSAG